MAWQHQLAFVIIPGTICRLQGQYWLHSSAGTGTSPCHYTSSVIHPHKCAFPALIFQQQKHKGTFPPNTAVSLVQRYGEQPFHTSHCRRISCCRNPLSRCTSAPGNGSFLRLVVSLFLAGSRHWSLGPFFQRRYPTAVCFQHSLILKPTLHYFP